MDSSKGMDDDKSVTIPPAANANQDDGFATLAGTRNGTALKKAVAVVFALILLSGSFTILYDRTALRGLSGTSRSILGSEGPESKNCNSPTTTIPQFFQTSPELWAGPTATGRAPFLKQTNPISYAPTATYVPNSPLETGEPIVGQGQNETIFHLMGQLSPYFPNPSGFGVAEYPLPAGARISQLQVRPSLQVCLFYHVDNSDASSSRVSVSNTGQQCF
jgi:hypothetical protein